MLPIDDIEVLVNEESILRLEVDAGLLLGAEADGEEGLVALEGGMLAAVDEGRIERLLAVGMQAVVGEIAHFLHSRSLDAYIFPEAGIVRNGAAEGVDALEATAADGEGDDLSRIDLLLIGCDRDVACYGRHTLAADTAFKFNSSDYKNDRLALYICDVDGQRKYVIPVYGMGLWGPINGYIALNEDKQTVYGAYFNHEGETAGLGAEIKDDASWQAKFVGKKLFAEGNPEIALAVKKKVDNADTQVDAVTGATLTSDGVSAMLHECLGKYIKFLQSKE